MNKICFDSNSFLYSTTFITIATIIAVAMMYNYITEEQSRRFKQYYDSLKANLPSTGSLANFPNVISVSKEKDPEYYPDRRYTGSDDYQMSSNSVGYIYNGSNRFPLYMNRSDRNYYYHIIDDSRNNIRIPLNNPKNEELYDNSTIEIPELGGTFTIKLYEYSGNRYNPFNY
jgi:hypothetical protein